MLIISLLITSIIIMIVINFFMISTSFHCCQVPLSLDDMCVYNIYLYLYLYLYLSIYLSIYLYRLIGHRVSSNSLAIFPWLQVLILIYFKAIFWFGLFICGIRLGV